MDGPVIIGIDELDKIQDADAARALLRDIKGIFEITGVYFLVSVSEEAAASLQLGTLQTGGRNEFNSSFYTVIELPPLDEHEAVQLLKCRGYKITPSESRALCLISAGNPRELVRITEATLGRRNTGIDMPEDQIIILAMREETSALLKEIVKIPTGIGSEALSSDTKSEAWQALPLASFQSVKTFVSLGKNALPNHWEPTCRSEGWDSVAEPWKRLLVRLFVSASVLELNGDGSRDESLLSSRSAVADLLNVMIMAGQDAGVARLMLAALFGASLTDQYQPSASDHFAETLRQGVGPQPARHPRSSVR
jgi:hypothetical protein